MYVYAKVDAYLLQREAGYQHGYFKIAIALQRGMLLRLAIFSSIFIKLSRLR